MARHDGGHLRPAVDAGLRAQIPFSGCRGRGCPSKSGARRHRRRRHLVWIWPPTSARGPCARRGHIRTADRQSAHASAAGYAGPVPGGRHQQRRDARGRVRHPVLAFRSDVLRRSDRAFAICAARSSQMSEPHNVYLSRQTLDIMIALKTCAGNSRYLLPSRYDADTPSLPCSAW